jgi:hypothetical protein
VDRALAALGSPDGRAVFGAVERLSEYYSKHTFVRTEATDALMETLARFLDMENPPEFHELALRALQLILDRKGNELGFVRDRPDVVRVLYPFLERDHALLLPALNVLGSSFHITSPRFFADRGVCFLTDLIAHGLQAMPELCHPACACLRRMVLFLPDIDVLVVRDVLQLFQKLFEAALPWAVAREAIQTLVYLFRKSTAWHQIGAEYRMLSYLNSFLYFSVDEVVSWALVAFLPLIHSGAAMIEGGVDIARIIELVRSPNDLLAFLALGCLGLFIRARAGALPDLLDAFGIAEALIAALDNASFQNTGKVVAVIHTAIEIGGGDAAEFFCGQEVVARLCDFIADADTSGFAQALNVVEQLALVDESRGGEAVGVVPIFREHGGADAVFAAIDDRDQSKAEYAAAFAARFLGSD